MMTKDLIQTDKILTLANLISLTRLLLLPVFFVLFVFYGKDVLAFIIYLVAASTDWIDGKVARATKTVSRFGQRFDPFVDRILIIVGVFAVFIVGRVPLWILLLLVIRDIVMFSLAVYMRLRFGHEFKVIFLGKLTTALVMAGFASLILNWPMLPGANLFELSFFPGWGFAEAPLGIWLLYIGVVISWSSAAIYLYRGFRLKRES
jgi:cardiolipin synthase